MLCVAYIHSVTDMYMCMYVAVQGQAEARGHVVTVTCSS